MEQGLNRWWRVVGGMSMNLALGALYAWSVFVAPLEKEFGWKRADVSMVFTIAVFVFGLSFILAGRMQDKLGPFKISIIGGTLVSIGFFACAYVNSLNAFFFWFGVMGGIGNGFGYATPIPVMAKWFPDRRGLAVGLAVAGYGGGSAIFGPLAAAWLIPSYGWRTTFMVLAVIFFVMTMVGAFLLQNPPAGYRPAGWTPAPATAKAAATTYEFTPGEVLKTPSFYFMWVAYALGTAAGLMVISQLVPFARSVGVPSEALATMGLVIGAAGNASGRILSGWMSDALGRLNVLRLMIAVSAIAMPILYHVGGNIALLYITVFVVYWCYGTQLSVNASTTSDFWGTKNAGVNYGLLFTAWGIAGIIGPRIGGRMFDLYQDYRVAFYTAGVLCAIAFVSELLAKRPVAPVTAKATA
ncbi:MAG TPA: OFA family MFS transporter [Candidatus Methylomirabilis sp.]|jgi:OFA family oxalate/formate antiporter-like MFS transporter|nr:OFA family MFS transporter [Candidatus Methylomirabilis sp.]